MPENETEINSQVEQQDAVDTKDVKDEQVADKQQVETNVVSVVLPSLNDNEDFVPTERHKDGVVPLSQQGDSQKETSETRIGVIDKIKNIIRRKADDDGTDVSDADSAGADDSTDEGQDIPAEFTTAALAAGWTKEQITDFTSDYSDDELMEQIPYLGTPLSYDKGERPSSVDSDKSEQPAKKEDDKKKDDKSSEEKDVVIQKLTERLDKLEKGQQKYIEKDAEDEFVSKASRANQVLDEASKEFEIFGTFEKLPRFPDGRIIPNSPQAKARNEVWYLAEDLGKTGMDFDTALKVSLNAFKGKNLVADVKRNLVKDLKKNETQLSAKRSSHESVKTDLSGPDIIREIGRKHGMEIN